MTRTKTWLHYEYDIFRTCPSSEFCGEKCKHWKKSQSRKDDVQKASNLRPHVWGNAIYRTFVDSNSLASSFGSKKKVRKKLDITKPRIKRISLREWCQTSLQICAYWLEKSIAQIDETRESWYFEASFCGNFHFLISQLKVRLSTTLPRYSIH